MLASGGHAVIDSSRVRGHLGAAASDRSVAVQVQGAPHPLDPVVITDSELEDAADLSDNDIDSGDAATGIGLFAEGDLDETGTAVSFTATSDGDVIRGGGGDDAFGVSVDKRPRS